MTHTELCNLGAKYIKANGISGGYTKPKYVVVEIELTGGAQPDIYAFGTYYSQQVEVKVSRSDFLSDKKKHHRINPEFDAGEFRSYLCPVDMIKPKELPENWGLLYVDEKNKIYEVVKPSFQKSSVRKEIQIISSVMRRIDIKSQIFSFKNHNV